MRYAMGLVILAAVVGRLGWLWWQHATRRRAREHQGKSMRHDMIEVPLATNGPAKFTDRGEDQMVGPK